MVYAKKYCELRADLSANIAIMKVMQGRLRLYKLSEESDVLEVEKHKEKLRIQMLVVENLSKQLIMLETELKRLSIDMNDMELKVFTLHYIKGYKLTKIAQKVYLSYDRVKQINKAIRDSIKI